MKTTETSSKCVCVSVCVCVVSLIFFLIYFEFFFVCFLGLLFFFWTRSGHRVYEFNLYIHCYGHMNNSV